MQPIEEQVILVTGATDGLGRGLAERLAASGATVLLHGRSGERAEEAVCEIREATGSNKLSYYLADFSSLDEVRGLGERILDEQNHLDILVNNAGIGAGGRGSRRELSHDDYELRFATNYLAPFLLTRLLLDRLIESAPARIVNVASVGQEPIDFDDPFLEHGYSGVRAYSQSKLAEIMFTFDLADELRGKAVTANCLHPATLMPTKMTIEAFGGGMASVEQGVDATLHLVTSPELDSVTGHYFNGTQEARANNQAYDEKARQRLREFSEELTGLDNDRKAGSSA